MVTVYSKNNCVQCKMTKRFLDSNNVSYREINLMSNLSTSIKLKSSVLAQLLLSKHQLKSFQVSNQEN
ncbi:nrdH-redoxin [Streptococcus pneumoniae]|nr:nrdH-redoxin [Streptococcus pneumoniae]